MTAQFAFKNTYAALPPRFFARVAPTAVASPRLLRLNEPLAADLGLDPAMLSGPDGLDYLSGQRVPEGADPIAMAYAGHQFGNFVSQLGDGRAILLGEVAAKDGTQRDIQLKGAGPTPFSRRGDGRAALGPVLREYIVSEAMFALGIPTTRSLAAVLTGEPVARETYLPGGVLTRVASSHIRVGTFQFFAAREDHEALRQLSDYCIARHYPDAASAEQPYKAFLDAVISRQASLIAQWMLVGFIHGVMNTDNCAIAGETIDYGPCAFMDEYDPRKVFSSIDQDGRYAYANQPGIGLWNMTRLAECLIPLLADDPDQAVEIAKSSLGTFSEQFNTSYQLGLCRKIGLTEVHDQALPLVQDLMAAMAENAADFTLTFRKLGDAAASPANDGGVRDQFTNPAAFDDWAVKWRDMLSRDNVSDEARRLAMNTVNPAIIPRNHRIEEAIQAAVQDDFSPFEQLVEALAEPFSDSQAASRFAEPPALDQRVMRTFCGT